MSSEVTTAPEHAAAACSNMRSFGGSAFIWPTPGTGEAKGTLLSVLDFKFQNVARFQLKILAPEGHRRDTTASSKTLGAPCDSVLPATLASATLDLPSRAKWAEYFEVIGADAEGRRPDGSAASVFVPMELPDFATWAAPVVQLAPSRKRRRGARGGRGR